MLLLLYPNNVNLQLAHHKNMLLYTFYNIYMYMIWIMSFTKHAFYIWTFSLDWPKIFTYYYLAITDQMRIHKMIY